MKDSSHQATATDNGAGQSAEPAERLLRRHNFPIGLVDVKHAEHLYDRTAGWVAHRFALLDHWKTRYGSDDTAGTSNSPFVFTITSEQSPAQSGRIVSSEAKLASALRQTSAPAASSGSEQLRVRRRSMPPVSAPVTKEPASEQSGRPEQWRVRQGSTPPVSAPTANEPAGGKFNASLPGADAPGTSNDPRALAGALPEGEASRATEVFTVMRQKAPPTELVIAKPISHAGGQSKIPASAAPPARKSSGDAQASATPVSSTQLQEQHFNAQLPPLQSSSSPLGERQAPATESSSISDLEHTPSPSDLPPARVHEIAASPVDSDSPMPLPPIHVASAELLPPLASSAPAPLANPAGPGEAQDSADLRGPAPASRAPDGQALRGGFVHPAHEQASRRAVDVAGQPARNSRTDEAATESATHDSASPPRLVTAEIRSTFSAPLGSPAVVQLPPLQSSSSPLGERQAPATESSSTSDLEGTPSHSDLPPARVHEIAASPVDSDSPMPLPPIHVASAELSPLASSAPAPLTSPAGPGEAQDSADLRGPAPASRTPDGQALRSGFVHPAHEQASRRAVDVAGQPARNSRTGEAATHDPASPPRLVTAEIRPSSASETRPRMVWRKVADSLPARDTPANGTSPGVNTTLPLSINRTGRNEPMVARQMTATPFTSAAEPGSTSSAPGAMPAATATSSGQPDLAQLAEMVGRMISRQLAVERERRGIKKWN